MIFINACKLATARVNRFILKAGFEESIVVDILNGDTCISGVTDGRVRLILP